MDFLSGKYSLVVYVNNYNKYSVIHVMWVHVICYKLLTAFCSFMAL